MNQTDPTTVSVLIPVLDEEEDIREATLRMLAQDIDGSVEFIFLDGGSADRTRGILRELAVADPRIRLVDNPHRRTPHALNIGLRAARGEFVARMDAHTYYPPSYLRNGVERLRAGDVEWVAGPQLARGVDPTSRVIARALTTLAGSGGAAFRRETAEEFEADTGFTGVWRKATLERYHGWDEEFVNDQDFELAARIRADGGRIMCVPAMAAEYIPRRTFRALARQYWRYGFFRVRTIRRHPGSMRRSHVLPPAVALAVLGTLAPSRLVRRVSRPAVAAYVLALLGVAAREERSAPGEGAARLPLAFAAMHLPYGFGFLWACLRLGPPVEALKGLLRR
jgi:succinoglycan biosynthesis protein ExoA